MKYIAIISDKFCQTKIFPPDLKTFTPPTYNTFLGFMPIILICTVSVYLQKNLCFKLSLQSFTIRRNFVWDTVPGFLINPSESDISIQNEANECSFPSRCNSSVASHPSGPSCLPEIKWQMSKTRIYGAVYVMTLQHINSVSR